MITEYLKDTIIFEESVIDWEDGIRQAAQPLLRQGKITEGYIDAMIQSVHDNGNYIILLPEIAMPHARPELGAVRPGLSLMKLATPVMFPGEAPVLIFIVLSAESNDGHLELIADLGEVLSDPEKVAELKRATNTEEVLAVFN